MHGKSAFVAIVFFSGCAAAIAQQTTQIQLKIEPANRTLTVSAEERVTADPDLAILHIGFETQPSDAKTAYAVGAKISNEIVTALKQAGIPEASIRSESQRLTSFDSKARKFKLFQEWTVKTPPERVAEILEIAIGAGATQSGDIEWTMKDLQALEDQALTKAATRAKADAAVLAGSMGVRLGQMIYVNNGVSVLSGIATDNRNFAALASLGLGVSSALKDQPLAIEPHKVSRTASVYAVFSIE
jgi:hypothetical protein